MTRLFDPFSDAFTRDPYSVYAELRGMDEPCYFEPLDCYLLSRFEDVDAVARNPQMLRSLTGLFSPEELKAQQVSANFHDMPHHERFVQFSLLECDGVVHHRLRMVVLREFSRSLLENHRQMIERYVDGLLAALLQEQAIEFIEDLAAKLPGRIIGSILGVPDEDCAQLRVWSEDIVQYFDADRTPERKALAESATAEFYEYLQMLIRERVKVPRTDLLTTLVRARDAGELDQRELVSTSLLILAAGHGSTIDVLGTGMLALLNHPEQMQQLRASPGLVEQAVQEMFRYESPLPYFHRYAAVDVEVMGRLFPAGTRFGLLYGSANRDAYAFPSAEEFHVDRQPNRHLAFGRGAHLCLGNNLARMSMAIVFRRLLEDTKSIELTEAAPVYRPGLSSRGLQHLRLSITAL